MGEETSPVPEKGRPQLSFWSIWNMCFGLFGLQFGWALQNAHASRIFQTLGADVSQIPILWAAAPLTGLLIQPLVGHLSDRTWCRLGRRRPYLLAGAVLSSAMLICLPRTPSLWIAVVLLWLLDSFMNVAMQPFRALVGDQLRPSQRGAGYAMQGFFIAAGSVVASILPWLLASYGVANVAGAQTIPDTVRHAFDIGAILLLLTVVWTVLSSFEYSPERLRSFADNAPLPAQVATKPTCQGGQGLVWIVLGIVAMGGVSACLLDPQLYLLSGGMLLWGVVQVACRRSDGKGHAAAVMRNLHGMPPTMRALVPVQFFSWMAFFALWIYATPVVAAHFFGTGDPRSAVYNDGANWVGVLFSAYNGFAALAAVVLPRMVRVLGLKATHGMNLILGAAGFLSFLIVPDADWLILSMLGVGFAWASMQSLPYAMVSDSVPADQMGLYMGVFNLFVVLPQVVAASVLGFVITRFFGGVPIFALAVGGVSLAIAAVLMMRVGEARG